MSKYIPSKKGGGSIPSKVTDKLFHLAPPAVGLFGFGEYLIWMYLLQPTY